MITGRVASRSQAGFTLFELLVVVAVGGIIAIPLMAWVVLGVKSEASNQVRSAESTAANLISRYLPPDVAASSAVTNVGGVDCTGGVRTGGTVVLSVVRVAASGSRVAVYTARTSTSGGHELVRRVCDTAGGPVTSETKLAAGLVTPPSGWSSIVVCGNRSGRVNDTCGQVSVSVRFTSGRSVSFSATRRAGEPL